MSECVNNLHKCQASCCKGFTLYVPEEQFKKLRIGASFVAKIDLTKDLEWYYSLHGITVTHEGILMKKIAYEKVGDARYLFHRRCNNLTEDNLCKGHPHNKPDACKRLTRETAEQQQYYLTSNCVFKR